MVHIHDHIQMTTTTTTTTSTTTTSSLRGDSYATGEVHYFSQSQRRENSIYATRLDATQHIIFCTQKSKCIIPTNT